MAVAVNPKEINRILHSKTGHNTIFNLAVTGGETTPVMIVDWQNDPIKENLLHVDLKRIDLTKRIRVKVPVHTAGEPKGVKLQGGLLELITREIEIECLPDEIPEAFHGGRQRADDRPEHPRQRHSADRLDEAGEPAGRRDLARRHAEGRRGAGGRGRSRGAAPLRPSPK